MSHRVAVVGAGGAGRKRAAAIAAHADSELAAVCDTDAAAAAAVAAEHGAEAHTDAATVIGDPTIDLVVVSTTHDQLAPVTVAALQAGKHVLCEKPLGRDVAEVEGAVAAARHNGRVLRAGYNHRFHPAVEELLQAAASGRLGPVTFVRGRYGHGGRPGYEAEWRADPAVSGGGELLDQGAHLVDLLLCLIGDDFDSIHAETATLYWDMPVEDNAFALLRAAGGAVASLHASWTQWRNLFSLEVFGRDGYAVAEGLGGSYGEERLILGRRRPEGGAPEQESRPFPGRDGSWSREWAAFVGAVDGRQGPGADGEAALRTMRVLQRIYAAAAAGKSVPAPQDQ